MKNPQKRGLSLINSTPIDSIIYNSPPKPIKGFVIGVTHHLPLQLLHLHLLQFIVVLAALLADSTLPLTIAAIHPHPLSI
jgi:hypothetical protein